MATSVISAEPVAPTRQSVAENWKVYVELAAIESGLRTIDSCGDPALVSGVLKRPGLVLSF